MVKYKNLEEYYADVLASLNVFLDDDRGLSLMNTPVTIKGEGDAKLRVVLPNKELMNAGFSPEGPLAAFHPLSENIVRGGESEIFRLLKDLVVFNAHGFFYVSALEILKRSVSLPKRTPGKILKALTVIPDVDEKSVENLTKVLDALSITGKNRIVTVRTRRGGIVDGVEYHRTAMISFKPLWDTLKEANGFDLYGIKVRKKDIKIFEALAELVLGKMYQDNNTFMMGSKHQRAPYYLSLMGAYELLTKRADALKSIFTGWFDDEDTGAHTGVFRKAVPMELHEQATKLHALWPPLVYNTGVASDAPGVVTNKGVPTPKANVTPKAKTSGTRASLPHTSNTATTTTTGVSQPPAVVLPHQTVDAGNNQSGYTPPWNTQPQNPAPQANNEMLQSIMLANSVRQMPPGMIRFNLDGSPVANPANQFPAIHPHPRPAVGGTPNYPITLVKR